MELLVRRSLEPIARRRMFRVSEIEHVWEWRCTMSANQLPA